MRASLAASTSATVVVPRSPRFRFVVLLLRMCCLNALPLRNFPPLVRLKRFAAPRWVFNFGIVAPYHGDPERVAVQMSPLGSRWRCRWLRPAAALGTPRQNRVHLVAFHPRQRLGDGHLRQFLDEPLENAPADFRMRHLTAAEEDR